MIYYDDPYSENRTWSIEKLHKWYKIVREIMDKSSKNIADRCNYDEPARETMFTLLRRKARSLRQKAEQMEVLADHLEQTFSTTRKGHEIEEALHSLFYDRDSRI